MDQLDELVSIADKWERDSFIIKAFIYSTTIMGIFITTLLQSPNKIPRQVSQILSFLISIVTSANIFLYDFDHKSLD